MLNRLEELMKSISPKMLKIGDVEYAGQVVDGKANGRGIVVHKTCVFEGYLKNNVMNGISMMKTNFFSYYGNRKKVKKKVEAFISLLMVILMMVNGKKINQKVEESKDGLMVIIMMVNRKKVKKKVEAFISLLMVILMMVNGKKVNQKVEESKDGLMVILMMVNRNKVK